MDTLASVGVLFDVVGAGQHVVIAERAIRTIEERVRSALCGDALFPYKLDKVMIVHVVLLWLTQCRNSAYSTSSPHVSPREQYLGRVIHRLQCRNARALWHVLPCNRDRVYPVQQCIGATCC